MDANVDAEHGLTEEATESDAAALSAESGPTDILNPHVNNDFCLSPPSLFRTLPAADAAGPDITASVFLSLILLVLAFFIVMVSMSRIDAERSAGVIGSVAGTFAPDVPKAAVLAPRGAQRGNVVDGEDLEQSLKRLFATELAVAEFRSVVPGRVLEIEIAGEALFHREEARIRLARSRLLDHLVATATMRPLGQRVDVQALVSTGSPEGSDLPTAPSALPVSRAGAVGEALIRRGLPRSRLAVGFWPGQNDRIVLVFSIAPAEGGGAPYPSIVSAGPNPQ